MRDLAAGPASIYVDSCMHLETWIRFSAKLSWLNLPHSFVLQHDAALRFVTFPMILHIGNGKADVVKCYHPGTVYWGMEEWSNERERARFWVSVHC